MALFFNAAQKDSYSSDPYHVMNRHVGFREKITFMRDRVSQVARKIAGHISDFRFKQ